MIVESVYDPESNLQRSGPTYEVWFNSNDAKCLCYSSEVNVPINANGSQISVQYNASTSLSFVFSCVQMLTSHDGKTTLVNILRCNAEERHLLSGF